MNDGSEDQRRLRRSKSRELLLETAARLFGEHPVDAVTIDDITQAANLAKGTFYNHFQDREALASEVRRLVRERTETAVAALNQDVDDAALRIARGLCFYARLAIVDPVQARLVAQIMPDDLATPALEAMKVGPDIGLGIVSGRLRVATRESGGLFVLGVGLALIHRLLACPAGGAAIPITQQMVALTLRGLGLDPAEAEYLAARAADDLLGG